KTYCVQDIAGSKGTVVAFICHHCPLCQRHNELPQGLYPKDSIDNMRQFASTHGLPSSYLHDMEQSVARAYGAVCMPDFFGYDGERRLGYRDRLDKGRTTPPASNARRELVEAMRAIATGGIPANPVLWVRRSIKWKAARSPIPPM